MSRNYKISDKHLLHFISFATVNWIDVFTRPAYKDIVVDSLNYCILNKGLEVYAWCIMSNHVHLITNRKSVGYYPRPEKAHRQNYFESCR